MSEMQKVEDWLAALLANLEPAARTRMLREVARDVRRIQQQNITAQRAPDGSAWEPRRMTARTKQGRVKRKMFTKLKTAKYLKAQANASQAEVTFTGQAQRIARVHHYGLRDQVSRGGAEVKYAVRPLLGVNDDSETTVQEALLRWLSETAN
ncbi:phage virion morphogenesis protein [Pantoea alhagi]|uniref:phage virion morphogenesis protein n=1 Tax=Pantoea alhagi TaxID=1891675 RepID=UPI00202B1B4D|nr:phage virion morphogenesis protein [Pantoea alhagi]URQ60030.1 phage virion morphogenesis protein [Pantoea alhagi]